MKEKLASLTTRHLFFMVKMSVAVKICLLKSLNMCNYRVLCDKDEVRHEINGILDACSSSEIP